MTHVAVTYDSLPAVRQALNRVRGSRYYMPPYARIAEAARLLLLILPLPFLFAGWSGPEHLLAYAYGYLLLRLFERFVKPVIYRKFAPHFALSAPMWPMQVTLAATGLHIGTPSTTASFSWAALPLPELRKDGLLIRLEPERSLPIRAADLPEGISAGDLLTMIKQWRAP